MATVLLYTKIHYQYRTFTSGSAVTLGRKYLTGDLIVNLRDPCYQSGTGNTCKPIHPLKLTLKDRDAMPARFTRLPCSFVFAYIPTIAHCKGSAILFLLFFLDAGK